jgi:hypothetical protein
MDATTDRSIHPLSIRSINRRFNRRNSWTAFNALFNRRIDWIGNPFHVPMYLDGEHTVVMMFVTDVHVTEHGAITVFGRFDFTSYALYCDNDVYRKRGIVFMRTEPFTLDAVRARLDAEKVRERETALLG